MEKIKGFALKMKKGKKEVVFRNPVLNSRQELEFTKSNLSGVSNIVFKNKMLVLNNEIGVRLEDEHIKILSKVREVISRDIMRSLQAIVNNEDKLILFPSGLKRCPCLVTTENILKRGGLSPKYNEILLYIFSNNYMENLRVYKYLEITSFEELYKNIYRAARALGLKVSNYRGERAIITTYSEVLKGI